MCKTLVGLLIWHKDGTSTNGVFGLCWIPKVGNTLLENGRILQLKQKNPIRVNTRWGAPFW